MRPRKLSSGDGVSERERRPALPAPSLSPRRASVRRTIAAVARRRQQLTHALLSPILAERIGKEQRFAVNVPPEVTDHLLNRSGHEELDERARLGALDAFGCFSGFTA